MCTIKKSEKTFMSGIIIINCFFERLLLLLLHSPNSSTAVSAASPAPSCSPATALWCGTTTARRRPLGWRRGTSGRWRPWGTSRRRGRGRGRRSCPSRARTTGGPRLSQVYLDEILFFKNIMSMYMRRRRRQLEGQPEHRQHPQEVQPASCRGIERWLFVFFFSD